MKPVRLALCAVLATVLLAACEEKIDVPATDASNPAAGATAGTPPPAPAQPVDAAPIEPVAVAADAVQLGTSVDATGAAVGAKPAYAAADTVHASLPTKGRTGTAKVYWTGSNGLSVKEEEKPLAGDYVNFQFSRADGMKPGSYNVEIDVDDVPAGIVDFTVQ